VLTKIRDGILIVVGVFTQSAAYRWKNRRRHDAPTRTCECGRLPANECIGPKVAANRGGCRMSTWSDVG